MDPLLLADRAEADAAAATSDIVAGGGGVVEVAGVDGGVGARDRSVGVGTAQHSAVAQRTERRRGRSDCEARPARRRDRHVTLRRGGEHSNNTRKSAIRMHTHAMYW